VNNFTKPLAVFSQYQTNGKGSRDNSWLGEKNNFYLSFVINKEKLPIDIKLQSLSIYFSYILKDLLTTLGSKVWLKWPNDFYLDDNKIGGTITTLSNNLIYCGIGLNMVNIKKKYTKLDINICPNLLVKKYLLEVEKYPNWKQIFSKYLLEFNHSKKFCATVNNKKISLENSILNNDGSIQIENKKVFSLR
jgi:BirA family biotin operon repressor/biotin-[acetyl-CoA-carboxylase] ligase